MIVLFTDFGAGPYTGQVKAVLLRLAPEIPVIDLLSDAPAHNPRAAAYLLAALIDVFPEGAVFIGVVDPEVGSITRRPIIARLDGRWFVGPDNGLFNVIALHSHDIECWEITWRPPVLSASFHGRDLFAPVAARLACGELPSDDIKARTDFVDRRWPLDLAEVIYIDHFGNVMTGIRSANYPERTTLAVRGHTLPRMHTFSSVPAGTGFCYKNAIGLFEIAVNRGRAETTYDMAIGDNVEIVRPSQ